MERSEEKKKIRKHDIWKETLLYNAEERRKSREQAPKEEHISSKRTLFYYGSSVFLIVVLYSILTRFIGYEASRYASVYSATIQAVSTIFALIAAGTLLLMERVASHSPKSLSFLPLTWTAGLFTVFVTIITLDILTMAAMPNDSSWSWLVNAILVSNISSIALSALYVKGLLTRLQPDTIFAMLYKKGKSTKSKEEASEVAEAIADLAMSAIQKREASTVMVAIGTFERLSGVFCQRWKGEDPGYDTGHPVRIVADCVGNIGCEAIAVGLLNVVDPCVDALCSMAFHHYDNQIHIDVWIFGNISSLIEALIAKKEGSGCISTLIMETKVAADQDKLSLAHWLACEFDEFARMIGESKDLEAAKTLAIGIEILTEIFAEKATSVYTVNSLREAIDILERRCEEKNFGSYSGFFGERGWPYERTISDIVKSAKVLMEIANKRAFQPQTGDWPTPAY